MKLTVRDIPAVLAKPEKYAALLLYGPDSGLARERAKQITSKWLGAAPDPMSILDVSGDRLSEDPALLADELSAIGLLASKRLLLVRDAEDKLTKILEASKDLLGGEVFVVVLAGELSPRSSLRAWFEKEPRVAAVPCYQDEAGSLEDVISDSFSKAQMQVGGDVMGYLVSQMGNDRYVTRQEMEKIITYAGDQKSISLAEAMLLVDNNRDTDMDEAIFALADKNLAGFDKAFTKLMKEGVASVALLRGLSRYFQRLYAIKLQAQSSSLEAVIKSLKPPVFFKNVPILTRHARQWELRTITQALKLISDAELACKTSDIPVLAASERALFNVAALR